MEGACMVASLLKPRHLGCSFPAIVLVFLAAFLSPAAAGGTFVIRGPALSDITSQLTAAFTQACSDPTKTLAQPAQVVVPPGNYIVRQVDLPGGNIFSTRNPCWGVVFRVNGFLLMPGKNDFGGDWAADRYWMQFQYFKNLQLTGVGGFNGQATFANWWVPRAPNFNKRPKMLVFRYCQNLAITQLRLSNPASSFINLRACASVRINNVTLIADGNSPNTDGIHVGWSTDVRVANSFIQGGDDCVVFQTDCSASSVTNVHCKFTNGISLGSLGADGGTSCVEDIVVQNVLFEGSHVGPRVKSWQGGAGLVRNVLFRNITVRDVQYGIIVEQFYDPSRGLGNGVQRSGAVALMNVTFHNVRGTVAGSKQGVFIKCSNSMACGLSLVDINLTASPGSRYPVLTPYCNNAFGYSRNVIPASCLKPGLPPMGSLMPVSNEAAKCSHLFPMAALRSAFFWSMPPKPQPLPSTLPATRGTVRYSGAFDGLRIVVDSSFVRTAPGRYNITYIFQTTPCAVQGRVLKIGVPVAAACMGSIVQKSIYGFSRSPRFNSSAVYAFMFTRPLGNGCAMTTSLQYRSAALIDKPPLANAVIPSQALLGGYPLDKVWAPFRGYVPNC